MPEYIVEVQIIVNADTRDDAAETAAAAINLAAPGVVSAFQYDQSVTEAESDG
jgi:hypothetical protein